MNTSNCFGAIGYVSARYETVELTKFFSKVAVSRIALTTQEILTVALVVIITVVLTR